MLAKTMILAVMLSGIAFAGNGIVMNMEITNNECNSNQITVKTSLANTFGHEKNVSLYYSYGDTMVENSIIKIAENTEKSFEDTFTLDEIMPGTYTLYLKAMDIDGSTTEHSSFEIKQCQKTQNDMRKEVYNIIHKRIDSFGMEIWQLFFVVFIVSNIIFSQVGHPFGSQNTIKIVPASLLSLLIVSLSFQLL